METPNWKKINGNEHTLSNWSISSWGTSYDLIAFEEYLNEMIALGWCPVRIRWGSQFTFVPCAPGEYICRIALPVTQNGSYDRKWATELSERLVADQAFLVEQRASIAKRPGIIALRHASLGSFEFSDIESQITHYKNLKSYCNLFLILMLMMSMMYSLFTFSFRAYVFFVPFALSLVPAYILWHSSRQYKKYIKKLRAKQTMPQP
ncbi:MAG: DUF2812 domain-containing protein [Coriobacteriia bacterium]|nr:DUF2812 domain-containing protein [Coriobacteriia bacterium]